MMGPYSAQPCPICCVPGKYLDAIDLNFPHCDTILCREAYEMAMSAWTEAEATHICKAQGICNVKVCHRHGPLYSTFLT